METDKKIQTNLSDTGYKNLNFFQCLWGAIYSPIDTFKRLNHKPKVLGMLLVIIVSKVALLVCRYDLFSRYIKDKTRIALDITVSKNIAQLSDVQIQKAIDKSPMNTLISIPFSTLIIFVSSALFILMLSKIFRGKGSIKQYFCLLEFAYTPCIIGLVFMGIISLFTNDLYLNASLTSLSYFLPDNSNPFIKGVASTIELFTIWRFILIGIGLKSISKLSKGKVYFIVGSLIVIGALISGINAYAQSLYYM